MIGWAAAWRIARRDLHTGFRGLRLLFLCLFLGVATLATIGSLTTAITSELAARGQEILGGDIEIAMTQREAMAADKAEFAATGALSETIRMRAMANAGGRAVLTEIKGVDQAYPLYGRMASLPRPFPDDAVLIDRALADRLEVGPGDWLAYGTHRFRVRAIIDDEPDRVGEGFTLGPVAIVSLDGLRRTGLIQPGSLYESKYRIRLAPGADPKAAIERLKARHPASGWEYKDRDRAAPGANRFFERLGQFLSLIGLAALVIAGIGVGNGVGSYLGFKRGGIATLKVLGASSGDIARIYLLQIGAVAALAILSGAVLGAIVPIGLVATMGDLLPVQPEVRLHPVPLATSMAYGALIAFIFTLPPLARARDLPAAALYRVAIKRGWRIDWHVLVRVGFAGLLVVGLAVGTARNPLFAAAVLGAVAMTLLLLLAAGEAIRRAARRMSAPRAPLMRLAIANLHRPGAQTSALVIALGLALTLFVTIAGVQSSLDAQISRTVPERAPNQFVLDIPLAKRADFIATVKRVAPEATLNMVPTLRGTITAYGSRRVADLAEIPEGAWFLRGERGVTYSATLPEGSTLVAGRWWPADYTGPPLVSLDVEAAKIMGVGVGDRLVVSVLGREIEARIASLRRIDWDTMGFNYILVYSPNALADAPHSLAATISMDQAREGAMTAAVLKAFPASSIIAIRDVIAQVGTLLEQMASAILLAASVSVLAGIAVLAGAIAASRQARSYDSVVLKTLGATRGQILGVQALEYALLAVLLGLLSLGLGLGAAWFVIVRVFDFQWAPDWFRILGTLGAGMTITLAIGLIGSLPVLAVRPARALRQI